MTGSLFQFLRNRFYYRVMRLGSERLSYALYKRLPSFREWWGAW